MRTERNFYQTTKAAFAFVFTTATYLLARTTGFLPSWFNGKAEDDSNATQINAGQRRLLQQGSVTIANPVPDQVIEVNQQYTYPLTNVFSGNYSLLGAVETGKSSLPDWLSLQPKLLSTYSAGKALGVAISGSMVFVASGNSSQILDIKNPSSPKLLSLYPSQSGLAQGIAISGNITFVADGSVGLQIIDVSNATNPQLLSTYSMNGGVSAVAVAVSGNTVFLAEESAGLEILDVTNKSNPQWLSTFPAGAGASALGIAISGSTAFVANYMNLQILDVSNTSHPLLLTEYPSAGRTYGVAISGSTAYVADFNAGLQILDISNTSNPRPISTFPTRVGGAAWGITISGGTAFVAEGGTGLQIIDVSNVNNPRLLATYPPGTGFANGVAISGSKAFVTNGYDLQILDVSKGSLIGFPPLSGVGQQIAITVNARNMDLDLASDSFKLTLNQSPRLITSTVSDQSLYPNQTITLFLSSELLFVNPGNSFLKLSVTLSNGIAAPSWLNLNVQPLLLSTALGEARGVTINGSTGFIAGGSSLRIFDLKQLSAPQLLGAYPAGAGFAYDVALYKNTALVANGVNLQILDVSNTSNPRALSTFPAVVNGSIQGVAVSDSTAFVAGGAAGLHILDMSNTNSPRLLSTFPAKTGGSVFGVAISDSTAFVAGSYFLDTLDVSNTSNPRLLSTFAAQGAVGINWDVALSRTTALVASSLNLQVLDIGNTSNPRLLSTYSAGVGGTTQGVVFSGSTAFVADGGAGLQILDMNNASNPRLLGSYPAGAGGYAYGVAVNGHTAFLADGSAGLPILDLSQWQLIATPGPADVGNYRLQLIATDVLGGSASTQPFTFRVEGPPRFNATIPFQHAKVGQAFNYFIPQGLISDPNFDPISFTALAAGQSSLLPWLSFNGISAAFSGTPRETDVGNFTILLSATDNIAGTDNTTFGLYVDHAPSLNQPIATQVAGVGLSYQFTVPDATIIDLDNDALRYAAQQQSGSPLPSWLSFNNITRTFSGVVNQNMSYTLVLLASDPYEGQASAVFNLLVENFPRANQPVIAPSAGVGRAYSFVIPANSFSDLDNEPLTYRVQRADGSTLPNWLSFNSAGASFSGVPSTADIGDLPLSLTATDPHGGSGSQNFTLRVTYFPTVATPISNQVAEINHLFQINISVNTFVDLDSSETLSYSAQSSGGLALPNWLSFNATTLTFFGNATQLGNYPLAVIASDSHGATATAGFDLFVEHFPQVDQPIILPVAAVGQPFVFAVSSHAFNDLDNNPLTYTAFSNGVSLPSWLSFNPSSLTFSGVPQATDRGVLPLQLVATDPSGASARQFFNLTITYFPTVATPIPNQVAQVNSLFQLIISTNTFVDLESGETLSYSAQSASGSSLPSWLSFNATALEFLGNATQLGNYPLAVIASDSHGVTATASFNVLVEHFPQVDQPIISPLAGVGQPFVFAVSSHAFSDVENNPLTYTAFYNGGSLPGWISFTPGSLTFSGVPQATDRGVLPLQLVATDPSGGSARQFFNITITYFPTVATPISNQVAEVNQLFQLIIPTTTFADLESGEILSYSAQSSGGLALPDWLSFNATMREFFGNATQLGNYPLAVIATDSHGVTAATSFNLLVEYFPQVDQPIVPPLAEVGQPFIFTVSSHAFSDLDNNPLTYAAFYNGGSLPGWLSFSPGSLTFSGVPQATDRGVLSLQLAATDPNGGSARQFFNITITYFPTVATPISNQVAEVNRLFQLIIPASTFVDLDTSETLAYSAQSVGGLPLPSWLSFNATTLKFLGNATQAGNYPLAVIGSDSHNLTATTSFNLLVEHFPQVDQPIISPLAGIGQPFIFTVSSHAFSDEDNNPLTYAAFYNGGSLPGWLSFSPGSLTFSGVPQVTDRGVLPLQLVATDPSGASARQWFNLTVINFPQVVAPITAPAPWRENRFYSFQVPNNTFSYATRYNASQSNSIPLPSWLQFNTTALLFSGTPTVTGVVRSLSLVVIAADIYGNTANAGFDLVINPNYLPEVAVPISDQLASVNQRFAFFIPAGSFVDRNQDALSYRASQSQNHPLPAWLHFDNESLSFSGTPGRGDTDPFTPRIVPVVVSVNDGSGEATTAFNINVQGTSWYGLGLLIGGPLISGLSFLYAAYQYRALYYNCRNKRDYQKLNTQPALIAGESFQFALDEEKIDIAKISTIQAKIPKSRTQCCRFFRSPCQEDFQALPGGLLLPNWMEYNLEQNCLRSKDIVPAVNYKNLRIEILDEAGIILKQIDLRVQKSRPLTITMEEDNEAPAPTESKSSTKFTERAIVEVELQPLNPPENLTPRSKAGERTPGLFNEDRTANIPTGVRRDGENTPSFDI